jgi:hypothetical protein
MAAMLLALEDHGEPHAALDGMATVAAAAAVVAFKNFLRDVFMHSSLNRKQMFDRNVSP